LAKFKDNANAANKIRFIALASLRASG